MRYAWLSLLLALPVSGQEFQFNITGIATPLSAPIASNDEPFTVSFDFNASSPTQTYSFANGCLDNFTAAVPITNLSSSLGGQPYPLSASSMYFNGTTVGTGICVTSFNFLLVGGAAGLNLEIDGPPATTVGTYPPVSLLQHFDTPSLGYLGGSYGLDDMKISVASVSVPEPGTLGLLAFAVMSLFALRARRVSLSLSCSAVGSGVGK